MPYVESVCADAPAAPSMVAVAKPAITLFNLCTNFPSSNSLKSSYQTGRWSACDGETILGFTQNCAASATLSALSQIVMIRSWMQKRAAPPAQFEPTAPVQPFIAVGDVHGRADLLEKLLQNVPDVPLIFVGDYVDRGDNSADVLRILQGRTDITCIAGNHEHMMLKFLRSPEADGPRWLRYGGLQTLASFGVRGIAESTTGRDLLRARNELADRMGEELITWVNDLPASVTAGNVTVVHAGADPALPIDAQKRRVLQWGHREFRKTPRQDGMWIVHGHTIVDEAHVENGRIAVDTGAYATGRLSAAFIGNGEVLFDEV